MSSAEIKPLFLVGFLLIMGLVYAVYRLIAYRRGRLVSDRFQKLGLRRVTPSLDGLLRRALVSPLLNEGQTLRANWAFRGQGPDWRFVVFEAEYSREEDENQEFPLLEFKTGIAFELPGGKLPQSRFAYLAMQVYARGNLVVCHSQGVRSSSAELEQFLTEGFQAVEKAKAASITPEQG